jgi:hypothetical protein
MYNLVYVPGHRSIPFSSHACSSATVLKYTTCDVLMCNTLNSSIEATRTEVVSATRDACLMSTRVQEFACCESYKWQEARQHLILAGCMCYDFLLISEMCTNII